MTLPPIQDWWSQLSGEGRQQLIEKAPHLADDVREQIREITGAVVGMREQLSVDDLEYARAQVDESA